MENPKREPQVIVEEFEPKKHSAPTEETKNQLLISDLGWSQEEAIQTYYRLMPFKEDWEAPGMEAYDAL